VNPAWLVGEVDEHDLSVVPHRDLPVSSGRERSDWQVTCPYHTPSDHLAAQVPSATPVVTHQPDRALTHLRRIRVRT
jgi:hypothetical protein